MPYKCIIWDWNGTLLDDRETSLAAVNAQMARYGYPSLTMNEYLDLFTHPVKDFYIKAGVDFRTINWNEFSREYIDLYQPKSLFARLTDRADAVLGVLQQAGVKQIVLSASKYENLIEQIEHFRIGHYFADILGIADINAESKIGLATAWMSSNDLKAADMIVIGDTVHDYETACALGCRCLLVAHGHQSKARLIATGVPVLDSLADVPAFLQS